MKLSTVYLNCQSQMKMRERCVEPAVKTQSFRKVYDTSFLMPLLIYLISVYGQGVSTTRSQSAVTEYSGVSKKGHAPYNPRKKNQDALIMTDDAATNTLILCVLDGHGEHGDGVSISFRDHLANEMISHPSWATDVKKASAEAIAKIEQSVIRNFRVDTEFSGTTLSMAIIRGNRITGVNIGDSRVIIGKTVDGNLVAEELTHDHKPDTPGEKERILSAGGRVFAVEYDDGIDGPPSR